MKAVILAGGLGTRISEESHLKPKPMIEIGGKPILWHIMKIYSKYDINDFIICLGYKGYVIKEYFANYYLHMSDVTFDMRDNCMKVHNNNCDPWKVTLIDTGENTMTGGRLRRVRQYLDDAPFCFSYGDGVSDVNIEALIRYHHKNNALVTLTAVQPPGRFGSLNLEGDKVKKFQEKPKGDGGWINGGFFVVNPKAINYVESDETIWEKQPLQNMAEKGELFAYKHTGFWYAMDTLRDKMKLENYFSTGNAPWKIW
jgi:glucose-1-phosphate cytidylyltransferase